MDDLSGSARGVSRRDALRITAVSGAAALLGAGGVRELLRAGRLHRVRQTRPRMGTVVTITVVDDAPEAARRAVEDAFGEIERLESLLSRHRPDTPLARLNATGGLDEAPAELLEVLTHAAEISERSGGAFDVTVAPLLQLYGTWFATVDPGRRDPRQPPPPERVRAALRLVDHRRVHVEGRGIRLERPGMALTLDGIAKGYVVDRTVEVLEAAGAGRVLVDAGGDMVGRSGEGGRGAGGEPWSVGLQTSDSELDLADLLTLSDAAVASSGDYMRAFTEDRRHHHIVDPRTGYSPSESSAVTVLAPSAVRADALSTAALVMGPEAGLAMIEGMEGVEAVVTSKHGERASTSGMGRYLTRTLATVTWLTFATIPAVAQNPTGAGTSQLFAAHDELAVTLAADFSALRDDRSESPDRDAVLTVAGPDGRSAEIATRVRTRGNFRLARTNCSFPPLRLDVSARDAVGTPFEGQDDLKLVSSCRPNRPSYGEMAVLEYLAYRIYGRITDRAFAVRPLRLTLDDDSGSEPPDTRFAFLIEDDEAIAHRLGVERFDLEEGYNLPTHAFDPATLTTVAVFQYMIGNTDWSAEKGHNVEILDRGGVALAIPYDFDFSGLVDAPYAAPQQGLPIRDVAERVYQGSCVDDSIERLVLERFRAEQSAILALVRDLAGLESGTRRRTERYLEGFYQEIETDRLAELRFLRHCRAG